MSKPKKDSLSKSIDKLTLTTALLAAELAVKLTEKGYNLQYVLCEIRKTFKD